MTKSDYDKYYKKGGTYVIPVEVFNELFDELERLNNIINELKLLAIDEKENKYWGNDSYINGKNEGVEELANAILEILDKKENI